MASETLARPSWNTRFFFFFFAEELHDVPSSPPTNSEMTSLSANSRMSWFCFFYHLVFCMNVFVRKKYVLVCCYPQKASYRKILESLKVKLIWQHFWCNAGYNKIISTRPLFYLKKSKVTVRHLSWKCMEPNIWRIENQTYNVFKALISILLLKLCIIWAVKLFLSLLWSF